jgi:N-acetylmuramoyl-L-alanine amidase
MGRRVTAAGLLLAWLGAAGPARGGRLQAGPTESPSEVLPLNSELRAVVHHGREVGVEVRADEDDDYASLATRTTGRAEDGGALRSWNGDATLRPGDWVHVPLALLSTEMRGLVLRNLFPGDAHDGADWIHVARRGVLPTYDTGLWEVAEWFTASGETFRDLMRVNGVSSPELNPGQRVRVPADLLHPAFESRPRSADGALEYSADGDGEFAVYRLRPGEALYSSVVVRFTGRIEAEDVRALADLVGRRSGVRDAHDIPVGFEVKIPFDLLEAEYLPAGHPRRVEVEAQRAEIERELALEPVARGRGGLRDVLIVLDPGHGGRDLGTVHNGIWEHDYVYDVACRLRHMIESETAARVALTLEDLETGCAPSAGDELVANRQGTILTAPPFLAREEGEAEIGVNLRWYLANSLYRRALKDGLSADRVLFLSLHADSRHPGLRGLMVYVPGASYRARTYGHSSPTYGKYREVQEMPQIRFSRKERVRSEAVSRRLAEAIVRRFHEQGLPVQPFKPVRDKVVRGRSEWVPAVLRGNAVPGKALVEIVNLGNREDAALLGSAAMRERMARGLLDAVHDYFGEPAPELSASR